LLQQSTSGPDRGVGKTVQDGDDPQTRSMRTALAWATRAGSHSGRVLLNPHPQPSDAGSLELPVDELLVRARPLPPHDEMVIDDLLPDEGAAFLATLKA
jgi:hypothetical protein